MRADTRARMEAFRRALELVACERSAEPVPSIWRDCLRAFPLGCCELASQTLVRYLMDHDKTLSPYVIALQWNENADINGHVFVALDGEYIDLTLNQFDGYDDRIVIETIESGGQLGELIQKVRVQGGTIETRKVTLDVISGNGHKLYGWLKSTADRLLAAESQNGMPSSKPALVSTEILAEYRDRLPVGPSAKAGHAPANKKLLKMTHKGMISECYRPREVRLRETKTQWISECGQRFRKSTGAAVGSGVWSSHRLDLNSIREIQHDE